MLRPSLLLKNPTVALLFLILIVLLIVLPHWNASDEWLISANESERDRERDTRLYLNGPATPRFRDNLRSDKTYLTGFTTNGLTNTFISHVNLIHIALLSNSAGQLPSIPVLPPFAPVHAGEAGIIGVGHVFDLPLLSRTLSQIHFNTNSGAKTKTGRANWRVLEWKDLKIIGEDGEGWAEVKDEPLGCWTTQPLEAGKIRVGHAERRLGLNISYTHVPDSVRVFLDPSSPRVLSSELAALPPAPLPPSRAEPHIENMKCIDQLYYAVSSASNGWFESPSPDAWRDVGVHMRWNKELEKLVRRVVLSTFGLDEGREKGRIPPFIAVHIRRSDFKTFCHLPSSSAQDSTCLPPLKAYAKEVTRVQSLLFLQKRIKVVDERVIVTSDEEDENWWKAIQLLGWTRLKYPPETESDRYGIWQLPLIDSISHSLAVGFVGTQHSTLSLVSGKRVKEWNGGVVGIVEFDPNRVWGS